VFSKLYIKLAIQPLIMFVWPTFLSDNSTLLLSICLVWTR